MPQKTSLMSDDLQHLGRRSLYNYIRFHYDEEDHEEGIESWEIEDYRQWSLEALFQELRLLGWQLDRSSFCAYAENSENPEALVDLLIAEDGIEADEEDRIFLIVFELWRRLIPQQGHDVEFLADELDYQIDQYDQGQHVDDKIDKILIRLLNLLHELDDEEAETFFELVSDSCIHDLEMFLYDFILDQFEAGAQDYARELHANFSQWVSHELWFDLLQIHWSDNDEALDLLKKMYKALKKDPQVDLLFEVVTYLSEREVKDQFELFFEWTAKQPLNQAQKLELKDLAEVYFSHHENRQSLRQQLLDCLSLRR